MRPQIDARAAALTSIEGAPKRSPRRRGRIRTGPKATPQEDAGLILESSTGTNDMPRKQGGLVGHRTSTGARSHQDACFD
jgi:hypothetical protein